MKIEILIIIENQKFWVSPRVSGLWEEFQNQPSPDEEAWAARLKRSLPPDLFNEFVSLLLAKSEEDDHRRAVARYIARRSRRR